MISNSVDLTRLLLPQGLVRRLAEQLCALRAPRLAVHHARQGHRPFHLPSGLRQASRRGPGDRLVCGMTAAQSAPPDIADGAVDEVERLRQQVAELQVYCAGSLRWADGEQVARMQPLTPCVWRAGALQLQLKARDGAVVAQAQSADGRDTVAPYSRSFQRTMVAAILCAPDEGLSLVGLPVTLLPFAAVSSAETGS